MKKQTVRDLTHIAIVAALYVVLTVVPPFNLISYGPYQFRIAEMFNLLGFYNRKYIIAVTLGCVIANFFSFNMIDVVVGSLSTLVFVGSGVYFFDRFKNQDILGGLFDQAHVFFAFYFSFFMVQPAWQVLSSGRSVSPWAFLLRSISAPVWPSEGRRWWPRNWPGLLMLSSLVTKVPTEDMKALTGGQIIVNSDADESADILEQIIIGKRQALNI